MTKHIVRSAAAWLVLAAAPGLAFGETLHQGVPALAGPPPAVTGTLVAHATGALERVLEIAFFDKTTGKPFTAYEQELTKELHVLAVDEARTRFVHEHGDKVGTDGRFRVKVRFPGEGLYHVYADAVPEGLGQQVLRFDVPVGSGSSGAAAQTIASKAPITGEAGPYTVTLDDTGLREGEEASLSLRISRKGKPAADLEPYLGVAAHAVFIAEDLTYVHAHAAASGGEHGHRGATHHGSHGSPKGGKLSPDLTLHVKPPRAGKYSLWLQFIGGGEVRTAPFTLTVASRS